jgi:hypothetical protein
MFSDFALLEEPASQSETPKREGRRHTVTQISRYSESNHHRRRTCPRNRACVNHIRTTVLPGPDSPVHSCMKHANTRHMEANPLRAYRHIFSHLSSLTLDRHSHPFTLSNRCTRTMRMGVAPRVVLGVVVQAPLTCVEPGGTLLHRLSSRPLQEGLVWRQPLVPSDGSGPIHMGAAGRESVNRLGGLRWRCELCALRE